MRNATIIGVLLALCALASACSSGEPESESANNTTTRRAVPTSISGAEQDELCDWYGGKVVINVEVSCDDVVAAGRAALSDFPDHAAATDPAVQLLIARVCTGAQADVELTYNSAEAHVGALADALVGSFCPGDRANVIEGP